MDENMKRLYLEIETEADNIIVAQQQIVENDRVRNGNREALTALRKRAQTTKTSVPSPFDLMMKRIEGSSSRPLVKEVCTTCGNHNSNEHSWMKFHGTDLFARIPFHACHTILEKDQVRLDHESKILQSNQKEKTLWLSEKGVLADKIGPAVLKSMVTLTDDKSKKCIFWLKRIHIKGKETGPIRRVLVIASVIGTERTLLQNARVLGISRTSTNSALIWRGPSRSVNFVVRVNLLIMSGEEASSRLISYNKALLSICISCQGKKLHPVKLVITRLPEERMIASWKVSTTCFASKQDLTIMDSGVC